MRRRSLIVSAAGAALLGLAGGTRHARAVPDGVGTAKPVQFKDDVAVPTLEELRASATAVRGTNPPTRSEVEKGMKILNGSPASTRPVEVAGYFSRLRAGDFDGKFANDANEAPDEYQYGMEWPVRANPVIVSFFDSTTLRKPAGDQTAWCSAFVNWCIARSDRGTATKSAASASFRTWGTKTQAPAYGDIVVFVRKSNNVQGHVGFFVGEGAGGIYVLGGNQMPLRSKLPNGTYDRSNTGEVNVKLLPMDSADLAFHSFRTDKMLY